MPIIKVKAKDPARVAAWERDPAHPGGECFVTGDEVHEVADTPFILDRVVKGVLVRVPEPEKKRPGPKSAPKE